MAFSPNRDAGCVSRHRNPDTHRRANYNEGWMWRIDDVKLIRALTRKETSAYMRGITDDIDVMRGYTRPECAGW